MRVLLSIKPEYVEKIFSGTKKFEYRKSLFKREDITTVVVYSTMPEGKIVGEFEIKKILKDTPAKIWKQTKPFSGIQKSFFDDYFHNRKSAYAIEVKDVQRYDKAVSPKDIEGKFTIPQSFRYLSKECDALIAQASC